MSEQTVIRVMEVIDHDWTRAEVEDVERIIEAAVAERTAALREALAKALIVVEYADEYTFTDPSWLNTTRVNVKRLISECRAALAAAPGDAT